MQTSLRYSSDSKALRIHAKEGIPVNENLQLQIHGEINTLAGDLSGSALIIRNFFPQLSASAGIRLWLDKANEIKYCVSGKKAFPISSDGLLGFNIKGRCDLDDMLRKRNMKGAVELSWGILNFKIDQDVRLKLGYEIINKVPYFQFRENNWTVNADINGKWNVRAAPVHEPSAGKGVSHNGLK